MKKFFRHFSWVVIPAALLAVGISCNEGRSVSDDRKDNRNSLGGTGFIVRGICLPVDASIAEWDEGSAIAVGPESNAIFLVTPTITRGAGSHDVLICAYDMSGKAFVEQDMGRHRI